MIPDGIYFVESEAERKAVEEFRFHRFVKEQKLFHPNADYKRSRLPLPEDSLARLLYVQEAQEVVACARLYRISHGTYTAQQEALFSPQKLHDLAPMDHTAIQDMVILRRTERAHHEELTIRIFRFALQSAAQSGATLLFTTCRQADLQLYKRLGFRPYREYYNSPETGLFLPLVLVLSDFEYLKNIKSSLIGGYYLSHPPPAHTQKLICEHLRPFSQAGFS